MKRKRPIDRFDALVHRPIEWQKTAANYIAAANFLYTVDRPEGDWSISSVGSNWPVMLLYATAAENLLKAIRIAQGEAVVVKGQLAEYFATHDLMKYATDAKVALGKRERSLTVKLQHVLEAGKYPVAKGPGKSARAWAWDNPGDVEEVWKLLQKFDDALRLTGTGCIAAFEVAKLQYAAAIETPQNNEMQRAKPAQAMELRR
jgi:hypothetical protein